MLEGCSASTFINSYKLLMQLEVRQLDAHLHKSVRANVILFADSARDWSLRTCNQQHPRRPLMIRLSGFISNLLSRC